MCDQRSAQRIHRIVLCIYMTNSKFCHTSRSSSPLPYHSVSNITINHRNLLSLTLPHAVALSLAPISLQARTRQQCSTTLFLTEPQRAARHHLTAQATCTSCSSPCFPAGLCLMLSPCLLRGCILLSHSGSVR